MIQSYVTMILHVGRKDMFRKNEIRLRRLVITLSVIVALVFSAPVLSIGDNVYASSGSIYRSVGAMTLTTGSSGKDYPKKTKVGKYYVWIGNNGKSLYRKPVKGGKTKKVLNDKTQTMGGNTVTNGTVFYYASYNWKKRATTIYKKKVGGKTKKIYSSKKDLSLKGFYKGYLYISDSKGIKKIDIKKKKSTTVKKGYTLINSYGANFVVQKFGDGYVNDMNTRYVFNAKTEKIYQLPVGDSKSYAAPGGIYNYDYSSSELIKCNYQGGNKQVLLESFYSGLWLSDDYFCFCYDEDDYMDGITYLYNLKTGAIKKGNGIW